MNMDKNLLDKMRCMDHEALEFWENEVARPSFDYSIRRLGVEEDAQDVSQETQLVMISLIKKNKAKDIHSPHAFAVGIARNKCNSILMKRARVFELLPCYWEHSQALLGQYYEEIMTMPTDKLIEFIDKLTNRQRQAIYLYFFEGLTKNQVAKLMQIEPATVRCHIFNALKALDEMIMSMENTKLVL